MNYALEIREHNRQPHLDIEKDIEIKKDGLFTFILRVNNGNIVDYQVMEYAEGRDYLKLKQVVVEEFTIARAGGTPREEISIQPDNIQRTVEKRDG